MARSMCSLGMFSFLPARIAVRKRGLEAGSPPPMRAAMVISRMTRVNTRPRFASVAAFLCLMVAHFECPDMTHPFRLAKPRCDQRTMTFARHCVRSQKHSDVQTCRLSLLGTYNAPLTLAQVPESTTALQ